MLTQSLLFTEWCWRSPISACGTWTPYKHSHILGLGGDVPCWLAVVSVQPVSVISLVSRWRGSADMYLSTQPTTTICIYRPLPASSAINTTQLVKPQKRAVQTYAGHTARSSADLEYITSRYQVPSEAARCSLAATLVSPF
jgi:hypothetical protein